MCVSFFIDSFSLHMTEKFLEYRLLAENNDINF